MLNEKLYYCLYCIVIEFVGLLWSTRAAITANNLRLTQPSFICHYSSDAKLYYCQTTERLTEALLNCLQTHTANVLNFYFTTFHSRIEHLITLEQFFISLLPVRPTDTQTDMTTYRAAIAAQTNLHCLRLPPLPPPYVSCVLTF